MEHTKKTAAEIEEKVTEAKKTSAEIDKVRIPFQVNSLHEFPHEFSHEFPHEFIQARELYRSSAARASVLYFILNDLNRINPMYQFSLKAFSVVFDVAIKVKKDKSTGKMISSQRAVMNSNVAQRVKNLTDSITFQVFQYTTRYTLIYCWNFKLYLLCTYY